MEQLWVFLAAAGLLSIERIAYIWIWREPDAFRLLCSRVWVPDPVDGVRLLFYAFKALQGIVFLGWCQFYGGGSIWPPCGSGPAVALGCALIVFGQVLNTMVFRLLGRVGVFYGVKFGYHIPWSTKFPFSHIDHPQYFGTVLSIWGFFLLMRFPSPDWIILPGLESLYYAIGSRFER